MGFDPYYLPVVFGFVTAFVALVLTKSFTVKLLTCRPSSELSAKENKSAWKWCLCAVALGLIPIACLNVYAFPWVCFGTGMSKMQMSLFQVSIYSVLLVHLSVSWVPNFLVLKLSKNQFAQIDLLRPRFSLVKAYCLTTVFEIVCSICSLMLVTIKT